MEAEIRVEVLILTLLLVASIVAIFVRRFRIPYTVALVIAGFALSFSAQTDIELDPDFFLLVILPPLIFEAAFHLNLKDLRENFLTILLLAVPGVILSMFLVGGVVATGAGLPILVSLVFGAIVAATDPVAVVAIFKKLGAPRRLAVLLEGESLFNDGTAIVIFNLAVVVALTSTFDIAQGLLDFVLVVGGGILVGSALGWLTTRILARIDDHLVETTLTTVLAFGSFLVAEEFLHVSGVLAVVAAGLIAGNMGPRTMSPTTRIVLFNFWEYMAFLANSAVFLLIGLQIEISELLDNLQTIFWAILAVIVARAVVVYAVSALRRDIPMNWRHVVFWGGLRGGVTLALALSLPMGISPYRSTLIAMAFGVVLFTLLIQGVSMGWLMRKLKVVAPREGQLEYERRHARALAAQAGFDQLLKLHNDGLISSHTWDGLKGRIEGRVTALAEAVQDALHDNPELEIEELITARREELNAQRSTLSTIRREGVISDETYEELVAEVDQAIEAGIECWAEQVLADHIGPNIKQLILVMVQHRDLEKVNNAMAAMGIFATLIQSTGGFLRRRNHLMLIGIPEGKLDVVLDTLDNSTSGDTAFLEPPDEMPFASGSPVPVNIRGATVFAIDVERYEEIRS
ncbi:MAG: Na+/H+ antiporter [Anaerolineales bacterium]|nr:Na+/H+ antiporter [Anaerolineales bacterium]